MEKRTISDDRIRELQDSHAQAWLDNMDPDWWPYESTDSARAEFEDIVALFNELLERRQQRCETCEFWVPSVYFSDRHMCELDDFTCKASHYCGCWKKRHDD